MLSINLATIKFGGYTFIVYPCSLIGGYSFLVHCKHMSTCLLISKYDLCDALLAFVQNNN
jgi:hypothetical protein